MVLRVLRGCIFLVVATCQAPLSGRLPTDPTFGVTTLCKICSCMVNLYQANVNIAQILSRKVTCVNRALVALVLSASCGLTVNILSRLCNSCMSCGIIIYFTCGAVLIYGLHVQCKPTTLVKWRGVDPRGIAVHILYMICAELSARKKCTRTWRKDRQMGVCPSQKQHFSSGLAVKQIRDYLYALQDIGRYKGGPIAFPELKVHTQVHVRSPVQWPLLLQFESAMFLEVYCCLLALQQRCPYIYSLQGGKPRNTIINALKNDCMN